MQDFDCDFCLHRASQIGVHSLLQNCFPELLQRGKLESGKEKISQQTDLVVLEALFPSDRKASIQQPERNRG